MTEIIIALIVAIAFTITFIACFLGYHILKNEKEKEWDKGHEERTERVLEFANKQEKYREENYYEIVANDKTYSFHKDELEEIKTVYGMVIRIELKNETIYIDDLESIKYPKGEKPKINFEQN